MPTFQMIPVADLVEPHNPQRQETLYNNIDIFRDSIRQNGLQQPIGVQVEGTQYRILWGHRRSIAVTQLQWSHIPAMVYQADEQINHDTLMGAENFHRQNVSLREEALYYKRVLPNYAEGTIGMARELNVPQSRIEDLLIVEQGNPKVFECLGTTDMSLAQAKEINKFKSPGYQMHALERVKNENVSADYLRRWRKDLQRDGLDMTSAEQTASWKDPIKVQGVIPQANCQIGNHMVELMDRKVYEICNEHYNIFLKGLEALGREAVIQDAGLWRQFKRLLAQAEGENSDGSFTTYTRGAPESIRLPHGPEGSDT